MGYWEEYLMKSNQKPLFEKVFSKLTYGFLGAGSLCQALLEGFLRQANVPPGNIFLSSRSEKRLCKVAERFGVQKVAENEELLQKAHVIFLCVKPQDITIAMESLAGRFSREQTVISFAAGVSLARLTELVSCDCRLVRVMPSMPASIGQGLFGYSVLGKDSSLNFFIEELFAPLGLVLPVREQDMGVLTVAGASGVGFVLELMQYWSEWLESYQLSEEVARRITIQTFAGTALWAKAFPSISLSELQRRVASKKGVTAAGLKAFVDSELDTILRMGFEKSVLCEQKLYASAKLSSKN